MLFELWNQYTRPITATCGSNPALSPFGPLWSLQRHQGKLRKLLSRKSVKIRKPTRIDRSWRQADLRLRRRKGRRLKPQRNNGRPVWIGSFAFRPAEIGLIFIGCDASLQPAGWLFPGAVQPRPQAICLIFFQLALQIKAYRPNLQGFPFDGWQ